MVDPNFMLIGAQKCGTSWLARMLSRHPDIYIPPKKEQHFFNSRDNYAKGIDWYRARFAGWAGQRMVGDCTPNYLWVEDAPPAVQDALIARGRTPIRFEKYDFLNRNMAELVREHYPDIKLIVIVRNPVDRAVSAFMHSIRYRRVSPRDRIWDVGGVHGIFGMGFYYPQLLKWMEFFDRDRFLFLVYEEDVLQNKGATLRRVFEHLGVDPDFKVRDESARINGRPCNLFLYLNYYAPWLPSGRLNHVAVLRRWNLPPIHVTEEDRAAMYSLYQPQYRDLEKLLGRSLAVWEPRPATVGVPIVA